VYRSTGIGRTVAVQANARRFQWPGGQKIAEIVPTQQLCGPFRADIGERDIGGQCGGKEFAVDLAEEIVGEYM